MRFMIRRSASTQSRLSSFRFTWQLALPCLLLYACSLGTNLTPVGQAPLGTVALERQATRGTTRAALAAELRREIAEIGAGAAIPEFRQSTKQRGEREKSGKGQE